MAVSERQGEALSGDQVKRVPRDSFSMPCERAIRARNTASVHSWRSADPDTRLADHVGGYTGDGGVV
jgi:hypothetical protein